MAFRARLPAAFLPTALLITATLLAGCTTRTHAIAYHPATFGLPDALPPAADLQQRPLMTGDTVTIRVYELASVSGDQVVDGAGSINVPLVGQLPAEGKTIDQFSADLTRALASKYLQSPHVLVTLKDAAQRLVTIDGAVRQPGVYSIAQHATLIQALAVAKGPTADANIKRVVIFRKIDGARQAAAFDLTTIRSGKDVDPAVYPNDVVVVDGTSLQSSYALLLRSLPLAAFFTRF